MAIGRPPHGAPSRHRASVLAVRCARPRSAESDEPFEQACHRQLRRDPELIVRFADHCPYTPHDVRWLQDTGRKAGVNAWVTSGKDWVKLKADWPAELPVAVPQLEIVWPAEETLPDLVEERLLER